MLLDRMKEGEEVSSSGGLEHLLASKAAQICQLPSDNPQSIAGFAKLTLPLVDHDYPASTPAMWNAAYRVFGFEGQANVMLAADPSRVAEIFSALRHDKRYQGGGAGSGFKVVAMDQLDETDLLAEATGAINIIVKGADGKLKGYNTDGVGYAESLAQKLAVREDALATQKVVILGGGGTANAIAFALAAAGARVVILNRTVATAEQLAVRVQEYVKRQRAQGDFAHYPFLPKNAAGFGGEERILAESADAACVVNVSLKGAVGPWQDFSALAPAKQDESERNLAETERILATLGENNPQLIISDINEQRREQHETPTLRLARQHGFATLGGLGMVVNQGVQAFMLVHGAELQTKGVSQEDVARVMREAVNYQPEA